MRIIFVHMFVRMIYIFLSPSLWCDFHLDIGDFGVCICTRLWLISWCWLKANKILMFLLDISVALREFFLCISWLLSPILWCDFWFLFYALWVLFLCMLLCTWCISWLLSPLLWCDLCSLTSLILCIYYFAHVYLNYFHHLFGVIFTLILIYHIKICHAVCGDMHHMHGG